MGRPNHNNLVDLCKGEGKGEGGRGKRLTLCDPGRKLRHPFSSVESSSAYQNPTALGGSVYRNVLSWCGGTAPPISGCLQMTMLCRHLGSR